MHGRTPFERCPGGSESALVFAARALADRGHHVEVFTRCEAPGLYDGVTYYDLKALEPLSKLNTWDAFVSLRFADLLQRDLRAGVRVLWCQDVLVGERSLPVDQWMAFADRLVFVSDWHRQQTLARFPDLRGASGVVRNPVALSMIPTRAEAAGAPVLVHLSRPERGLEPLLEAWPSIRARVPGARLLVARYRSFHEPAGSQVEAFSMRMDARVRATEGAEHIGHLSKPQLYDLLSRAALMVYPARFDETSCIAAIESQACGVPVAAVARGALPETLSPDAASMVAPGPGMVQRFADRVVELLFDPARRAAMGLAGRARAMQHDAAVIAEAWEALFLETFASRRARAGSAIDRSLWLRGDRDASALDAPPTLAGRSPAVAAWPGWGEKLVAAVAARVTGARRILSVGEDSLAARLAERVDATVVLAPRPPESVDVSGAFDAAVDWGGLLCAADRPAYLRSLAARVRPGGPIVHALPAAPARLPGQRVYPDYDDIWRWFGDGAGLEHSVTLEAALAHGEPARCWVVACPAGAAAAGADALVRKRWLHRPPPTVSACMIVRDAADTVATTLNSLLPIADEIRVLDTGSADGTQAVIRAFAERTGAPVVLREAPWPEDFSLARNQSMEGASGDWILWIDADERLLGAERLRVLLRSEVYEAFAIRQHNHVFDRGVTQVEIPFRVFRNGRGYRFFGAVHEHPERALNEHIRPWLVAPGVDILHYGYLTEPGRRRKLLGRNLALLMKDFERYPGRRLTDVLYLRDCVNLARFDLEAGGPVRGEHRAALEGAVSRFEAVCMPRRDPFYHLGRSYYDEGLKLLGQGRELQISVGAPGQEPAVHRVRNADDAVRLALDAASRFVGGEL